MKSVEDLKAAFAGESQANRKYLAFAIAADKEGYPQIAKLFRAVAAAETVHAHNHFRALGQIKSTAENLQAAIEGEHYEIETMYPDFIGDAEAEEARKALRSFNWAWEVEKIHRELYREALEQLDEDGGEDVDYWVCAVCGHTHVGSEPPEQCPICKSKAKMYEKIV